MLAVGAGAWPETVRRSARAGDGKRAQDEGALPNPAPSHAHVHDLSRVLCRAAGCSGGGSVEAAGDADDGRKTRRKMKRRMLKSEMNDALLFPLGQEPEPGHERTIRSCVLLLRCPHYCDYGVRAAVAAERRSSEGAGHGSSGLLIGTQKQGHSSILVWNMRHPASQTEPY